MAICDNGEPFVGQRNYLIIFTWAVCSNVGKRYSLRCRRRSHLVPPGVRTARASKEWDDTVI